MHAKRPRKWWQLLSRPRCTCGLPWVCLELRLRANRHAESVKAEERGIEASRTVPRWAAPTASFQQIGRAGSLTPAQTRRAGGGR